MIVKCNKIDCLWNDCCDIMSGGCKRDEIIFQPSRIFGEAKAVCRCFSRRKVRGHMDWSRFPQGGSIDDHYADVLANDKEKHRF